MKPKKNRKDRSAKFMAMHDMAQNNRERREDGEDIQGISGELLSKETTKLNRELGLRNINSKH